MTTKRAPYWNIWWTFMLVAMAFTLLMVILEVYGVFHDAGIILGAIGVLVTLVCGFTASTRSSVVALEAALGGVTDRLLTIDVVLEREIPAMHAVLVRIESLLATRLPPPPEVSP